MVWAFTGHRPEKLPWGTDESDPRRQALRVLLERKIEALTAAGGDTFLCGMARGCDLLFAEAVLSVAERRPETALEAWLPCPEQADRWPRWERERYRSLLERCSRVYLVEEAYSEGCMLRRNRAMVDAADGLLSVWDGSAGGTGWTVGYAKHQGKTVVSLWL